MTPSFFLCILLLVFWEIAVNVQRVIHRGEIMKFTRCLDYFIYSGITKFNHFPRFNINKMVML